MSRTLPLGVRKPVLAKGCDVKIGMALLVFALPLAALPVRAQLVGDPAMGRQLTQQWCTACHVVDVEGHGSDVGPPLPQLLGDGKRTSAEIRGWLVAPHPRMPNFDLTRQEIEDIVAYLQSLAGE